VQPNLSQTPLVDVDSRSGSATPVSSPSTELNLELVQSVLTDVQGLLLTVIRKVSKVNTDIAVRNRNHHTATGNHMPYGITQCYVPPGSGDFPAFITAEAGTQFSDPGGMQDLS